MRLFTELLSLTVLLLVQATSAIAQPAVDPSGHWEGIIPLQGQEVKIEIDLVRNSKGELAGTFGQPDQGMKGFPLSNVAAEGRAVRFVIKADAQPAIFTGALGADGKLITGKFAMGEHTVPADLTRLGDARIAPVPKSAPIGKELEGAWNGSLDTGDKQMRLTVKMANQPDGTAAGTVMSVDGSGVEVPIGITQKASNVTIDVPSVGASFAGVLNTAGTELNGTWTQTSLALSLTLRRVGP